MNIAGKTYKRGLYCHAVSDVLIKLPSAAKTLFAEIGVDSNDKTSGGRGSVEFIVRTGDKKLFHSKLTHEGAKALPLKISLNGAKEFSLQIINGGDGIGCDQSDWANARVELEDGTTLWLDDLPILGGKSTSPSTDPLFSFTYNGKSSKELLPNWNLVRNKTKLDPNRIAHTLTWQDPNSGLRIRCNAIQYLDYPTVEWTVYFKNTGTEKTPILENIQALDATFQISGTQQPILHHQTGAPCRQDDYKPMIEI